MTFIMSAFCAEGKWTRERERERERDTMREINVPGFDFVISLKYLMFVAMQLFRPYKQL